MIKSGASQGCIIIFIDNFCFNLNILDSNINWYERKFTEEEIIFALSERDWSENDEIETEIWHAFKKIDEKVLRVVVKGREEPYYSNNVL